MTCRESALGPINALLHDCPGRKVVLWLGELCGSQTEPDIERFAVGNFSLSAKVWDAFSRLLTKTPPDTNKVIIVEASSGAALNGLRHGFTKLSHFTAIVIPDLQPLLRRHYREFWTESDTSAIFSEYYWPLHPENLPRVTALYDHITHHHVSEVARLHSNSRETTSNKNILHKLCQEFNIDCLYDRRNILSPPEAINTLLLPTLPLPPALRDLEKTFKDSRLLNTTLLSTFRHFELGGKEFALQSLDHLRLQCKSEKAIFSAATSKHDSIVFVRGETWQKRWNQVDEFLDRVSVVLQALQSTPPPTQHLFAFINDNLPSLRGSIVIATETSELAQNMECAYRASTDPSLVSSLEIRSFGSLQDLSSLDHPEESTMDQHAKRLIFTSRSLLERLTALPNLEHIIHVGHISNSTTLAKWHAFASHIMDSGGSGRLTLAFRSKEQQRVCSTIKRYLSQRKDTNGFNCGAYDQMFGELKSAATLASNRPTPSPLHRTESVGPFSCSLTAMWQVVHRFMHMLPNSHMRTGEVSKFHWLDSSNELPINEKKEGLYRLSTRVPVHAAVGPYFESSSESTLIACKRSIIKKIFHALVTSSLLTVNMSPSLKSLPRPHTTSSVAKRRISKDTVPVPILCRPFVHTTEKDVEGYLFHRLIMKLVNKTGPEAGKLNSSFFLLTAEPLLVSQPQHLDVMDREHNKIICELTYSGTQFVSKEAEEKLNLFHTRLLSLLKLPASAVEPDWSRSSYKYLVAPCIWSEGEPHIDWTIVNQTSSGFSAGDWSSWPGSYVFYAHEPAQRYLVREVDFQSSPKSPSQLNPEISVADAIALKHKWTIQDLDQPLIKVKLVGCKPFNGLLRQTSITAPKGVSPEEKEAALDANPYRHLMLVPEIVKLHIKTRNIPHESLMILPSLLHRIELLQRAQHLYTSLHLDFVPLSLALTSLTTVSASEAMDLEVLETVGDMLLKVIIHEYIASKYPRHSRFHFELYRHCWISNAYQSALAVNQDVDLWMNTVNFNGKMRLAGFADLPAAQMATQITEKQVADCMEAMLGACFEAGGMNGAQLFLQNIGLGDCVSRERPTEALMPQFPSGYEHISALEQALGYEWKEKALLLESLTHESFPSFSLPSFHRLGLIGDALFDYFIVMHHSHAVLANPTPGDLTFLKSLGVCGMTQSVIAHHLKLHTFLLHQSSCLDAHLRQFSAAVDTVDPYNAPFWKISALDFPEALAMCLEAIVGAVYVDCGHDLQKTWDVFKRPFSEFWMRQATISAEHIWPKTAVSIFPQAFGCRAYKETKPRRLPICGAFAVDGVYHDVQATGIASSKKTAVGDSAARVYDAITSGMTKDESDLDYLRKHCTCPKNG